MSDEETRQTLTEILETLRQIQETQEQYRIQLQSLEDSQQEYQKTLDRVDQWLRRYDEKPKEFKLPSRDRIEPIIPEPGISYIPEQPWRNPTPAERPKLTVFQGDPKKITSTQPSIEKRIY